MKRFAKFIVCMVMFFLNHGEITAQPMEFLWLSQISGKGPDEGWGITADQLGNIIVTGDFEGTASFGDTTLTSIGRGDIFVAKYDANGNCLWVVQAGGTADDLGVDIASDNLGNIFVTGLFFGTATFGDITLSSKGGWDIFVAKYDANGNLLWVVNPGGIGYDGGAGIILDRLGNILVTGWFSVTATFSDTLLTSFGDLDIFVAKYDPNGNLIWVLHSGGKKEDQGWEIAIDEAGNSFVTGYFSDMATFGDTTLISFGDLDIFLAKYDTNGNLFWVVHGGGTGRDVGRSVAIDNSNNSLITGWFSDTAAFSDTTITSIGNFDMYVAKYNDNSDLLWILQAGGEIDDMGNAITTDRAGNILVTGLFWRTAVFGKTTLTSKGFEDIFVAKYNSNGNLLWTIQAGGNLFDSGMSITTNESGVINMTGFFSGTATFGDTTLMSEGKWDIFIAQLGAGITSIQESTALPHSFKLHQNYPNPFNPGTTIRFTLPNAAHVSLKIYNLLGQEVTTLVDERLTAGEHRVRWEPARTMPSGVYVARLEAEGQVLVRKMVLIR